jgi:hypothetical protein
MHAVNTPKSAKMAGCGISHKHKKYIHYVRHTEFLQYKYLKYFRHSIMDHLQTFKKICQHSRSSEYLIIFLILFQCYTGCWGETFSLPPPIPLPHQQV